MVVAIKGQLYLLPEHRPAKFEPIDQDGLYEAGYGPAGAEGPVALPRAATSGMSQQITAS
jgi:hypothetical protein